MVIAFFSMVTATLQEAHALFYATALCKVAVTLVFFFEGILC